MHIVQITPGAGGMYCGSCLQGNTLAGALRRAGVEVTLVPVYTPLRTDEPAETAGGVFFGGINVYLQQNLAFFRKLPAALDRWLDHPALLRRVTASAGGTRPEQLGPLTVSMLRGEEGLQRKELDRLINWLQRQGAARSGAALQRACWPAWPGSCSAAWACRWSAPWPAKTCLSSSFRRRIISRPASC